MNRYIIQAIAIAAQAQEGADIFTEKMRERAQEKWEKSKLLPRKLKKEMRKDALLDARLAIWSSEFSENLFTF